MRFEPIYQYRLWGVRRLSGQLSAPLPGDGPVGEAWILSDRDDHPSHVANGPLERQTICYLMQQFREQLMGKLAPRFSRFPLLLKFLDEGCLIAKPLCCGDCRQKRRSPLEKRRSRVCWFALTVQVRLSTKRYCTQFPRATYGFCLRSLECAFFRSGEKATLLEIAIP